MHPSLCLSPAKRGFWGSASISRAIYGVVFLLTLVAAQGRADVTLAVNSPAARFSPGTWSGDMGRGGSLRRVTWNNGAWCAWRWSTTEVSPHATLQISNPNGGSAISYFLDGVLTDNISVPATGGVPIVGLTAPGAHTLVVYTRNSQQADRWSLTNACTVTGLTLDNGATPIAAPPLRPWVLIVGDSITEGIQADNGRDSNLADYSFLVGQGLNAAGFDYAVSACGYSGWIRPGDARGDVPAYYAMHGENYRDLDSRWNKIDDRTSLLDSRGHLSAEGGAGQEPALILFNYGVNECLGGADKADMQASVTDALNALRRAAPRTQIVVLVPPGLADTHIYVNGPSYIAVLKAAVAAYGAAHPADRRTTLLDLGPNVARALGSAAYGGGVHPRAAGHAYLAPLVLQAILARLK